MTNDPPNEPRDVTETDLKTALDLAGKGFETTSKALFDGAKMLNEASQQFAEKAPGKRASWLGFLLVMLAISVEILSAFKQGFEFSDTTSAGMLIIGGLLVVAGGAFDTYFTLKTTQAIGARAETLERAAEEARAQQVSLLSRLVGRGG